MPTNLPHEPKYIRIGNTARAHCRHCEEHLIDHEHAHEPCPARPHPDAWTFADYVLAAFCLVFAVAALLGSLHACLTP